VTTPDELYAAILADPDDMGLRLAYADAIEVTDPQHAALIRAQIEHTRRRSAGRALRVPGPAPLVQAADEVGSRARGLAQTLHDRLGTPVADLVESWALSCGFPEVVDLTGADFLAHGDVLYARAPVRHVILSGVDADLAGVLAASPLLDRLSSLSLRDNPIGDEGVRALVSSTHLRKLRWLDLERCGIGRDGAETLAEAAARTLPDLRWLGFEHNRVRLVPYGEGQDPISGQYPVDVYVPEFGLRLNERYGPFPWMDEVWAWDSMPGFGVV
jgi:uncharacterized protein (TIGR02996 family)